MNSDLSGKRALVTGASRGIGHQIAIGLAGEGVRVAVCGRDRDALDVVVGDIEDRGAEAISVVADITEPGVSTDIVDSAAERFGGLEILVTCAAANAFGPVDADTSTVLSRLHGKAAPSIESSQAAVPLMRDVGFGRIVLIGGLAARMPFNRMGPDFGLEDGETTAAQGLGNAALAAFAKYLSDDVAADGITVNVVHPGLVATERTMRRLRRQAKADNEELAATVARITAGIPTGRLVEPVEVADLVVFLASARASAITGQSIAVDGGHGRTIVY